MGWFLLILPTLPTADDWADFAKLSRHADVDRRCQAIETVRKHRDLRMAQALVPLFADPHPRVRVRAVDAFRAIEDPAVIDFLVRTALKHPDPRIRLHGVE